MKRDKRARRSRLVVAGAMTAVALGAGVVFGGAIVREARSRMGNESVESRVARLDGRIRAVWENRCKAVERQYPPAKVVIVALKEEKLLHVFADGADGTRLLASYPILAASGNSGPKLREGDRQVPEGIYRAESLNPNSRYHLAIRVNYPSDEDRAIAASEGRTNLGGDIMIHGSNASIGCIAIGDAAIEEVFYLAAIVGIERVEILMAPGRRALEFVKPDTPRWVAERYEELAARMERMKWGG